MKQNMLWVAETEQSKVKQKSSQQTQFIKRAND